ncbi:hypothetical protein [Paracoccus xiamenensis]|uniref:hypothetical protein n=1 Tax=Paracoccus xiamenensis TaxID=2714901 RepID=UPI001408C15D|nr:hypothetical protein [Paracoccus xiamenensis]
MHLLPTKHDAIAASCQQRRDAGHMHCNVDADAHPVALIDFLPVATEIPVKTTPCFPVTGAGFEKFCIGANPFLTNGLP